jgi:hypothetical protein
MTAKHSDIAVIKEIALVEADRLNKIYHLYSKLEEPIDAFKYGAETPGLRPYIIRTILGLPIDDRKKLFGFMVELSTEIQDVIDICRNVIKTLPRAWVDDNIMDAIEGIPLDHWTARRIAELLDELGSPKIEDFLKRLSKEIDPEILEICDDYKNRLNAFR